MHTHTHNSRSKSSKPNLERSTQLIFFWVGGYKIDKNLIKFF